MIRLDRRSAVTGVLGFLAVSSASALPHQDDPKILDLKAPIQGTGWTPGQAARSSARGLFDASNVSLQSWLTTSDLGVPSANGNDCWGYVSPSGREYALMGTTQATIVVEVTNPAAPVVVGSIPGQTSLWRDVKSYDTYAYAVSEDGGGMQVIDLSNVDSGSVSLVRTITGHGTDATHNVIIDEDSGFLYRLGGGSNGLRIYDLSTPSNPTYVGAWTSRYVHDAQIVTMTSGPFAGSQLAFCCAGLNGGSVDTGLTILDVTNKSNIQVLSQLPYPSRAYSHQGWLSEDRQIFYLGDELDEGSTVGTTTTHIFDVSNPAAAAHVGSFDNGNSAVGHNMYTHGGLLYQANYTSGLRVFDYATDPLNPVEVAYFDTSSGGDDATFNGAWSVYPYLPSGTILISDIEGGLFVVRGESATLAGGPAGGRLDPDGEPVAITATGLGGAAIDPAAVTLHYDIGAGYTTVQLSATGNPDEYAGAFPAIPCGTAVSWYFEALTTTGGGATLPSAGALSPFEGVAADALLTVREDNMETAAGWSAGAPGDTATTGIWTRSDPNGTSAQPEDDHSPSGTRCWFTGQASAGSGVGTNDVDGGTTTLLSPVLDLSGQSDPILSYWRWYSNDAGASPNADTFDVDISNDGGSTWTSLEVVGPSGAGTSGGWIEATFRVSDFVALTNAVRVRFVASDLGSGSIVEAAIDDFRVEDIDCGPDEPGAAYCVANPNSTGNVGVIFGVGSNVVADDDLSLFALQLPPNQFGMFVVSRNQGFAPNLAGGEGNLCLAGSLGRHTSSLASSGLFGELSLGVDLSAIPEGVGSTAVLPGETWNWQCWHRDAGTNGATSNLTRGYSVTFE